VVKAPYDPSVPLGPDDPLPVHVEAFLHLLGTKKPSANTIGAYRRDLIGVATRIAALRGTSVERLQLEELTKGSLRAGFASWAADHAEASVLRARSAWSGFFDYLVAEDLLEGNPMAAVGKPKLRRDTAKVLRASDAAQRLLETAAQPDPRARNPWPERDVALVATFLVTGIRLGEALALTAQSIDGPPGARRLRVVGKGGVARSVPIDQSLEQQLGIYLATRRTRFPRRNPEARGAPLFVGTNGEAMTRSAVQYSIARLYRRAGLGAHKPAGALVHALRHSFATQALETGADVVEVQELLGHSDLKTTRLYLQATADQLRDVVRAHPAQIALREFSREQRRLGDSPPPPKDPIDSP
jgi:site-specific recombinase XerD